MASQSIETVILRGSWGELTVHRSTGHIVEYDDHGKSGWSSDDIGYHDIAFIDPASLTDSSIEEFGEADILSASFATKAGEWVDGMHWDKCVDDDYGDWVEHPLLLTHTPALDAQP